MFGFHRHLHFTRGFFVGSLFFTYLDQVSEQGRRAQVSFLELNLEDLALLILAGRRKQPSEDLGSRGAPRSAAEGAREGLLCNENSVERQRRRQPRWHV